MFFCSWLSLSPDFCKAVALPHGVKLWSQVASREAELHPTSLALLLVLKSSCAWIMQMFFHPCHLQGLGRVPPLHCLFLWFCLMCLQSFPDQGREAFFHPTHKQGELSGISLLACRCTGNNLFILWLSDSLGCLAIIYPSHYHSLLRGTFENSILKSG